MSNIVFPTLPGLTWDVIRRPNFSTRIQTATSGKKNTAAFWTYPIWDFSLTYNFLRETTGYTELQTLAGFFLARQGGFDSFLYTDPIDNAVTGQAVGTGDGVTTAWVLPRAWAGFVEPVWALNGAPAIYVSDWQGNQRQYSTPRTNLWLQSQALSTSPNTVSANAVLTPAAIIAPDGTTTGNFLAETAVSSVFKVYQTFTQTAQTYTFEVYAKPNGRNWLYLFADTGAHTAFVDVQNKVVGNQTGAQVITFETLANSWVKVSMTYANATIVSQNLQIFLALNNGTNTYTGTAGTGVYLWGIGLKALGLGTSYIPTTTTPVTVTDYSLSGTTVTFTPAPSAGATITWTGNFFYRVRFKKDSADFNEFMFNLWELKTLELESVK